MLIFVVNTNGKLFCIQASTSGGGAVLKNFLFLALVVILFNRAEKLVILKVGVMGNIVLNYFKFGPVVFGDEV